MQLSPVLAMTVTVPDGVSVSPDCGVTKKETFTGSPTIAGLNATLLTWTDVLAFIPVPLSCTCWVAPAAPPPLSVKVSAPLAAPTDTGANATFSWQLPFAGIGEAATQFCVVVNGPLGTTLLMVNRAVPVFVTVTGCVKLEVPNASGPNVRLTGDTFATAVPGEPAKTYAAP